MGDDLQFILAVVIFTSIVWAPALAIVIFKIIDLREQRKSIKALPNNKNERIRWK